MNNFGKKSFSPAWLEARYKLSRKKSAAKNCLPKFGAGRNQPEIGKNAVKVFCETAIFKSAKKRFNAH